MHESWKRLLAEEFQKPYFRQLAEFVREERKTNVIFPAPENVFRAFETPYDQIKVVMLGQDPYPGAGQAHGLCFSVLPGVPVPKSLRNIYRELEDDVGVKPPKHGCLEAWAERGVFLLNSILTVRAHSPKSHEGKGWEIFTSRVIQVLSAREDPLVFILWGADARKKASLVDSQRHMVVESAHPSPLSAHRGFFGSKPFSVTNEALKSMGKEPLDWSLTTT
jgi:uracil-DNA glycosylase